MSLLVPTRRVAGPARRGARASPPAEVIPSLLEPVAQADSALGSAIGHEAMASPPKPGLGEFADLWTSELGAEQVDGEQLELEAMTEYLAHSFSGDIPTLEDLQLAAAHCPGTDSFMPNAVNIKAEYDDGDRRDSGARASGWAREEAPSGLQDGGDDTEGNDGDAMSSKRRRRIRNLKQQELNRLAQQRYRQRKKKKHSDLQSALDALTEKLAALDAMSKEAEKLRATQASLQRQLADTQAALLISEATVLRQRQQLVAQQERLQAQERQIQEHQVAAVAAARASPRPSGAVATPPGGVSSTSGGVDTAALREHVLNLVRAALQEVSSQQGGLAQAQVQDAVVQHLSRSLSSCCLDYGHKMVTTTRSDPQPVPLPVSVC